MAVTRMKDQVEIYKIKHKRGSYFSTKVNVNQYIQRIANQLSKNSYVQYLVESVGNKNGSNTMG